MPLKVYRYAILEADTRALELWLGTLTVVWASWLVLACPEFIPTSRFWETITHQGGNRLWSGMAGMVGSFQLFSMRFKSPIRRWAASASVIHWSAIAYALIFVDLRMWPIYMAICFTVAQLMIAVRRKALE